MKLDFAYTGVRVRDLDAAVEFFTTVLGMKLEGRVKVGWTKGEFANLVTADGKHWLEINWYPDDSPAAEPFREGEELDHLGFETDDFDAALARLKAAGCEPQWDPFHGGGWHIAFVPIVEGLWLDLFQRPPQRPRRRKAAQRKKAARKAPRPKGRRR